MIVRKIMMTAASLGVIGAMLMAVGCSENELVSPGIQPEIVNTVDNFQFQVSAMSNYSGTLEYAWSNTGPMAVIDQSCAVSSGAATLVLLDDVGAEVYSKDLAQDGSYSTSSGTAGTWTVRVVLSDATGTLNFRADKATP